jgi:hypothetical protein
MLPPALMCKVYDAFCDQVLGDDGHVVPRRPSRQHDCRERRGGHDGGAMGYSYRLRLMLVGAGSLAGVKQGIKPLFSQRSTTFSDYGTTYRLWFGKPTIENLGNDRFAVMAEVAGVRVDLKADLQRFCEHLASRGCLSVPLTTTPHW